MSGRRSPARRRAPARGPARRRGPLARAAGGNRPFVFALLVVVVLLGAMAAGPVERYADAANRVDALVRERDALAQEVDALEQRAGELHEPEEIELLARSELGLVLPGEEAYVIVGPSPSPSPQPPAAEDGDVPWYRRLGRLASGLLR